MTERDRHWWCRTPKQLIEALAVEANTWKVLDDCRPWPPGKMVVHLSERERELLKQLTPDDIKNIRVNPLQEWDRWAKWDEAARQQFFRANDPQRNDK